MSTTSETSHNPYQAPPVTVDPPTPQMSAADAGGAWGYQSARGAASVTKVFLYINGAVAALSMLSAIWAAVSLSGAHSLSAVRGAATSLMAYGLFAIVELLARLACAIPFCIWFHRAYANLRGLGCDFTSFAPGWAPGSFFVPFINLVRPQQIAKEIWINSSDDDASTNWGIVNRWWGFWLAGNIISYIGSRMVGSVSSMSTGLWIGAAGDAMICAAAITAAVMVGRIETRQNAMADKIATRAQAQGATPVGTAPTAQA